MTYNKYNIYVQHTYICMEPESDGPSNDLLIQELTINEYKDYFRVANHLAHSKKHKIPSIKRGNIKLYIINSSHNEFISTKKYTPVQQKEELKQIQKSFNVEKYKCTNKGKYVKPTVYYNLNNPNEDNIIQDIDIKEEITKVNPEISKYWNDTTKKLSECTKIPYIDNYIYDKAQFKNYSNFESSEFISSDFGKSDNIKLDYKTVKVRFYPTKENVKFFNFCFDAHDYMYNSAIMHINSEFEKLKNKYEANETCCIKNCKNSKAIKPMLMFKTCEDHKAKKVDKNDNSNQQNCLYCDKPKRIYEERKLYTCSNHLESKLDWSLDLYNLEDRICPSKRNITNIEDAWKIDIPAELGKKAVQNALDALKTCCSLKRNGAIKHFKLKPREQLQYRVCNFDKRALHVTDKYVKILSHELNLTYCNKKKLDYLINAGTKKNNVKQFYFKVVRSSGKYYLLIPKDVEIINNIKTKNKVISLDPGIRTFQTGYDPAGTAYKFAESENLTKINKLFCNEDKIRRSLALCDLRSKTRYNLFKKLHRVKSKVKNIIDNMHNQISSFIAKNYDNVILPSFMSSQMLKGTDLSSYTKRWLSMLSHFKFKEKLVYACSKHDSKIYLANESYTTKCCGRCGELNDVGKSKIFNCAYCSLQQDRDIHAARNIYLRRVTMKN